jgi:hypothetical protein
LRVSQCPRLSRRSSTARTSRGAIHRDAICGKRNVIAASLLDAPTKDWILPEVVRLDVVIELLLLLPDMTCRILVQFCHLRDSCQALYKPRPQCGTTRHKPDCCRYQERVSPQLATSPTVADTRNACPLTKACRKHCQVELLQAACANGMKGLSLAVSDVIGNLSC